MKNISILGSTGSIGSQTLEIVRQNKDKLRVIGLLANSSYKMLADQVREFNPEVVAIGEKYISHLKGELKDYNRPLQIISGEDAAKEVATLDDVELVVTAMVGMVGIRPTLAAIKKKKNIALANKETLVAAGSIIMNEARKNGVNIYPVDSEHSAIFQCLRGENTCDVENLILTASGGPFRGKGLNELKSVTLKEALNHPNWSMGKKITIDSATLVNKGLEVIEAVHLFDMNIDDVSVVIHPQSIIHSMVSFRDGSIKAQLGLPDMKIPIAYALFYPHRNLIEDERLDFFKMQHLDFEKPDLNVFSGLKLAFMAGKKAGNMTAIFNAANEKAVEAFLNEKISFLDIYSLIEYAMEKVSFIVNPTLDDIFETEKEVYALLEKKI